MADVDGHYTIHAYVGEGGSVVRYEDVVGGRVTFRWIYRNRPNHARYAIAGHRNEYVVWDLFDVQKLTHSFSLKIPQPWLVHVDLDAAIMATVLLYHGGDDK